DERNDADDQWQALRHAPDICESSRRLGSGPGRLAFRTAPLSLRSARRPAPPHDEILAARRHSPYRAVRSSASPGNPSKPWEFANAHAPFSSALVADRKHKQRALCRSLNSRKDAGALPDRRRPIQFVKHPARPRYFPKFESLANREIPATTDAITVGR